MATPQPDKPAPPNEAPSDAGVEAAGAEPIMDRRTSTDRRSGEDRREKADQAKDERRAGSERRQGDRRKTRAARNINQYDMTDEVLEFVNAVNRFRELSANRFPSAKDILQILMDLGYEKRS